MEIIPEFEYDPEKSRANQAKHGIDFEAVQALWHDKKAVEVISPYQSEPRFLKIGNINGKIWTTACTYRAGTIRIISTRRARSREERAYFTTSDHDGGI